MIRIVSILYFSAIQLNSNASVSCEICFSRLLHRCFTLFLFLFILTLLIFRCFCNGSNCWNLNVTLKGVLNEQASLCSRPWLVPFYKFSLGVGARNISLVSLAGWMELRQMFNALPVCTHTRPAHRYAWAHRFMLYLSFHHTHMHTPVEAFSSVIDSSDGGEDKPD